MTAKQWGEKDDESLVKRLRSRDVDIMGYALCEEAAKEIERLQRDLEYAKADYHHELAKQIRVADETSKRWRYASFENPPHDHEWTDHAYCELCGLRYDSQPAETTAAVRTSMDYGGGPFNEDGIEGPAEKTGER